MGNVVSPRWMNVVAMAVVIFLTTAGVLFGVSMIAPNIFAALGVK